MSRLSVLSWLTSGIVHTTVFALLGTLLIQQMPLELPDAYGNRDMSSHSPPQTASAPPVDFELPTPIEVPQPVPSTLPENQSVSELLEGSEEAPEDEIEPPEPVEEALDSSELLALNDSAIDPVELRRSPRTKLKRRNVTAPTVRPRTPAQMPRRSSTIPQARTAQRHESAHAVPQLTSVDAEPIPRQQQTASVSEETAVAEHSSALSVAQPAGTTTKPARLVSNPSPVYPSAAIQSRLEGTVILRVTVAASGRVIAVAILQSSGHDQLDAAARSAVKRWKFEPAVRDGHPVEWSARLPVRFRLD
ncbi:MAG: energy transducer TonB [Planctomycetota bacterium]